MSRPRARPGHGGWWFVPSKAIGASPRPIPASVSVTRFGPGAGVDAEADCRAHQAQDHQGPPERVEVGDGVAGHDAADEDDGQGDAEGARQADDGLDGGRSHTEAGFGHAVDGGALEVGEHQADADAEQQHAGDPHRPDLGLLADAQGQPGPAEGEDQRTRHHHGPVAVTVGQAATDVGEDRGGRGTRGDQQTRLTGRVVPALGQEADQAEEHGEEGGAEEQGDDVGPAEQGRGEEVGGDHRIRVPGRTADQ